MVAIKRQSEYQLTTTEQAVYRSLGLAVPVLQNLLPSHFLVILGTGATDLSGFRIDGTIGDREHRWFVPASVNDEWTIRSVLDTIDDDVDLGGLGKFEFPNQAWANVGLLVGEVTARFDGSGAIVMAREFSAKTAEITTSQGGVGGSVIARYVVELAKITEKTQVLSMAEAIFRGEK